MPVAFAAHISEDRTRCAVAAGWREPGGRVVAEIAWYGPPDDAVAEVARLAEAHDPVDVVVDGRSQSATLIRPLLEAGVAVHQPTTQQVVIAHGNFMDLVAARRLRHLGQRELTDAVRAAQQRKLAGALAWESRGPAVDQCPLVAATEAVWALLEWEAVSDPDVWEVGAQRGPGGREEVSDGRVQRAEGAAD